MFVGAGTWSLLRRFCRIVSYVDCVNSFDPYLVYKVCRDESALDRVHVARPFTVYQLRELVYGKLEGMLQSSGARALIVSGLSGYRADSPLEDEEYESIQERVLERIESLTRDYQLYTVVSCGGSASSRAAGVAGGVCLGADC